MSPYFLVLLKVLNMFNRLKNWTFTILSTSSSWFNILLTFNMVKRFVYWAELICINEVEFCVAMLNNLHNLLFNLLTYWHLKFLEWTRIWILLMNLFEIWMSSKRKKPGQHNKFKENKIYENMLWMWQRSTTSSNLYPIVFMKEIARNRTWFQH